MLQEYEADIVRLVRLAYPSTPDNFLEQLAVDSFIDRVLDAETHRALRRSHPKTLDDALY